MTTLLERFIPEAREHLESAAAGLLKLLHPHRTPEDLTEQEIAPIVELAVEMRKRTTDQLAKALPTEFSRVDYSYKLGRGKY